MKDHVEIGHLAKYSAFRVNRDQVMDIETWFKIHTDLSNFDIQKFGFINGVDNVNWPPYRDSKS